MTDYIFIPVPISEKPKEERTYNCLIEGYEFIVQSWFWLSTGEFVNKEVTHYLRKVPRQEWEREQMIGFAEWVGKEGWAFGTLTGKWLKYHNGKEDRATTADLLQTYLETI